MKWIVWGSIAILVWEIGWSLVGNAIGIDAYVLLGVIGESLIFMFFAFGSVRDSGRLRDGVLTGAFLGLVAATIGWAASTLLGPSQASAGSEMPAVDVAVTVLIVTAIGAFFGLISALIARRVGRRIRRD